MRVSQTMRLLYQVKAMDQGLAACGGPHFFSSSRSQLHLDLYPDMDLLAPMLVVG